MLKNLLFNKLRSNGNRQADEARDTWTEMRDAIESTGNPSLNVNRFILHWWLCKSLTLLSESYFAP